MELTIFLKSKLKTSLLILAGGLGSRYGGLKQVDGFGPNNESILDYSIYDAIKSGFEKIVILTTNELKGYFEKKYADFFKCYPKITHHIVNQNPRYGLKNFNLPKNRIKPWGTGHAILCCENVINEPFAVINADDFYGRGAYKKIHDILNNIKKNDFEACIISYLLKNTLSENGSVTRGVCKTSKNKLIEINETFNIKKNHKTSVIIGTSEDNKNITLEDITEVSMNLMGFKNNFFNILNKEFDKFLTTYINHETKEFLLPSIVNKLISTKADVYVETTNEKWFGITFKEDKKFVKEKIKKLIKEKIYPTPLWK